MRMAAFLFVVLVAAFATYKIDQQSIHNLEAVETRTCVRVQFLRDQANGTNFLIYDTFKMVVDQQKAALKAGKLQGTALKQAKQSITRAQKVVNTTVVTGPTDCRGAVFDPHYKAPAPEFIAGNSKRVKAARIHAAEIIKKAKLQQPLYDSTHQPHPRTG